MLTTTTIRSVAASRRQARRAPGAILGVALVLAMGAAIPGSADELEWIFESAPPIDQTNPPLPPYPIQLIVDDDTPEGVFGVGAQTAQQFLWFNRFANPGPFRLDEIWVLFPAGAGTAVGDEVQLAVYLDPDGDPSNGADLLTTVTESVQAVDGSTFSVYPLGSPLTIVTSGDILIGVVDRFVESGVTPPTAPASMDTTASQGRSWLAVWTGDPPDPPLLPPDGVITPIDTFQPGNWMIRGFGSRAQPPAVPVVDGRGILLLVLLLSAAGWVVVRGRR